MATRNTKLKVKLNPEQAEADLRLAIKSGVNIFGFSGVLSLLADEASERADGSEEETSEQVLDAIETAIEEVEACEAWTDDEQDGDDEDYDQEDYIVTDDGEEDDEEESDDADDEDDEDES